MHVNCQQLDLENTSLHFIYLKFPYDRAGPSLLGGLSLVGERGGSSPAVALSLSLRGGSSCYGAGAPGRRLSVCGHGLSCPVARGIFPSRAWN